MNNADASLFGKIVLAHEIGTRITAQAAAAITAGEVMPAAELLAVAATAYDALAAADADGAPDELARLWRGVLAQLDNECAAYRALAAGDEEAATAHLQSAREDVAVIEVAIARLRGGLDRGTPPPPIQPGSS